MLRFERFFKTSSPLPAIFVCLLVAFSTSSVSASSVAHIFLFAGFRQAEVERKIYSDIFVDDSSPVYQAHVYRYEITDKAVIVSLAEAGRIASGRDRKVPGHVYIYRLDVLAEPTDASLYKLLDWATETTECRFPAVSVSLQHSQVYSLVEYAEGNGGGPPQSGKEQTKRGGHNRFVWKTPFPSSVTRVDKRVTTWAKFR